MKGQASTDYVAILLLVAVVAAAAAAVADGTGIAEEVRRQMARALCVVGRGDCEVDRRPCTVASRRRSRGESLTVAVFKFGHDRTVVREQRSDGTIAVTLLERDERGLQAGVGGRLAVSLGRLQLALGGEATASALAARGDGTTWVLHDRRAADALVEALADHGLAAAQARGFGAPAALFGERSLSSAALGSLSEV